MSSSMSPRERQAMKVIAREMHKYDVLSQPCKIRYERHVMQSIDKGDLDTRRDCAHGIMLHSPCEKCCRTVEDCKAYEVAAMFRLKELLAILEGKA